MRVIECNVLREKPMMGIDLDRLVDIIEEMFLKITDSRIRRSFILLLLRAKWFSIPVELISGEEVSFWVFLRFFRHVFWSVFLSPVVLFHWLRCIVFHLLGNIKDSDCNSDGFYPRYILDNKKHIVVRTTVFKEHNVVDYAEA